MSQELAYLPPNGTKWQWHPKALNYAPWVCGLSPQKYSNINLWPLHVILRVDLIDNNYRWTVEILDWKNKRTLLDGQTQVALEACLAAEKVGEEELEKLMPDWVHQALANGWRPPC